jgi:hypothetical protein
MAQPRLNLSSLAFPALALVLAAVGVYGVMAFAVTQHPVSTTHVDEWTSALPRAASPSLAGILDPLFSMI